MSQERIVVISDDVMWQEVLVICFDVLSGS